MNKLLAVACLLFSSYCFGQASGLPGSDPYQVDGFPSSCAVGSNSYTTRADCAFYTVQAALIANGNHGAKLHFGNGVYTTCAGLVNSNANPAPTISLEGEGEGGSGHGFGIVGYTSIQASCTIPKTASNPTGAVVAHAPIVGSSISVPYGFTMQNLVIDPNGNSDQAAYITAEKVGHIDHIGVLSANQTSTLAPIQIGDSSTSQAVIVATVSGGAVASLYVEDGGQYSTSTTASITSFTVPTGCPGSGATGTFTTDGTTVVSAAVTAGGSGYVGGACSPVVAVPAGVTVSGSGYQFHANDVFVENGANHGPSSWATVTVSISTGVPTFTVTGGGTYTFANPVAYWIGYTVPTSAAPCSTMGTLVPTMSGSGPYSVTALTGYGFSGCVAGATTIEIVDEPQAQYGWEVIGDTDSSFNDVVVGTVGTSACVAALSGSDVYSHVHPIDCNVGVYNLADNTYIGPEFDTPFQYGLQEAVSAQSVISGAEFVYAQAQPNTSGFFVPASYTGKFDLYGSFCNHGASVTNFALMVVGGQGPIAHGKFVYPGDIVSGMQCDTRAIVNYSTAAVVNNTTVNVLADSATTGGVEVGGGTNTTNWGYGVSGDRAIFGYTTSNGGGAFISTNNGINFDFGGGGATTNNYAGYSATGLHKGTVGTAIPSAATIAPTAPITHVTGTTTITTITPSTGCTTSGTGCTLILIFDGTAALGTGGNIDTALTTIAGQSANLVYDPASGLWFHP